MGMFDNLKKKMGQSETDAEKQSRLKREAEVKKAADKRDEGTRKAEEERRKTKGYQSDYSKKFGSFSELFLKKKK